MVVEIQALKEKHFSRVNSFSKLYFGFIRNFVFIDVKKSRAFDKALIFVRVKGIFSLKSINKLQK